MEAENAKVGGFMSMDRIERLSALNQISLSEEERAMRLYTVRSLVAGATLMLEDGSLPSEASTFRLIREALRRVLFLS